MMHVLIEQAVLSPMDIQQIHSHFVYFRFVYRYLTPCVGWNFEIILHTYSLPSKVFENLKTIKKTKAIVSI